MSAGWMGWWEFKTDKLAGTYISHLKPIQKLLYYFKRYFALPEIVQLIYLQKE
jgi:hypothetical protein